MSAVVAPDVPGHEEGGDRLPGVAPVAQERARAVAAAFLLSLRTENTRRGYARDLRAFFAWCAENDLDPLAVRRVHLDAYRRHLEGPRPSTGRPAAASSIARALSALTGFYNYAVGEDILDHSPAAVLHRPKVGTDSQATGLDRGELQLLLAAAEADGLRSRALVTLLAHNGLRIDEALSRDVEHLGHERGHRVLRLRRKGGRSATAALAPPTVDALEVYLAGRATGPIFITRTGRRMDEPAAWRLIRRLARRAELASAGTLNPHALRHAFVTAALEAGVPLHEVQDAAGHADPGTTQGYNRARHNLDRHATYAVTAFLSRTVPDPDSMVTAPNA